MSRRQIRLVIQHRVDDWAGWTDMVDSQMNVESASGLRFALGALLANIKHLVLGHYEYQNWQNEDN